MMRSTQVIAFILALIISFAHPDRAYAFTTVEISARSCESFNVVGTSESPFIKLEVAYPTGVESGVYAVKDGAFDITLHFEPQEVGTEIVYWAWGANNELGLYDGNGFSLNVEPCRLILGPSLPPGFVQHTISCNVAVYDQPGGTPVGLNQIRAGQTWYIDPEPKTAPDGSLWTAIFVSGVHLGYIPTGCVE
jgi:hypothetical protein